jgi:hypothetical protein
MKKADSKITQPPPTTKSSIPPIQGKSFNPANFVRPGVDEAQIL